MIRRSLFSFLSVFICISTLQSQETERILQIDQQELSVLLNFNPEEGEVSGKVQINAFSSTDELDSIWIDAIQMKVSSISLNNEEEVKFDVHSNGIAVFPKEPIQKGENVNLIISYSATPKRGMFFVGWDDPTGRARKQIWTQGQGIDNRHWLPHVDDQRDKLITSVEALFDSNYTVISNGELITKEESGPNTGWKYQMKYPHSSYLMMIAIGEYALNGGNIKISYLFDNH